MEHPDPRNHKNISFIKSAVRITGCVTALLILTLFKSGSEYAIWAIASCIGAAEFLGIFEELV